MGLENRLKLNHQDKFTLPDNVKMFRVQPSTHNIEAEYDRWKPNIRICSYGANTVGRIVNDEFKAQEIWIITEDTKLLNFIQNFDLRGYALSKICGTPSLSQQSLKELLKERYYGK